MLILKYTKDSMSYADHQVRNVAREILDDFEHYMKKYGEDAKDYNVSFSSQNLELALRVEMKSRKFDKNLVRFSFIDADPGINKRQSSRMRI